MYKKRGKYLSFLLLSVPFLFGQGTTVAAATLLLRRRADAALFSFSRFCDNKLSSLLRQRFPTVGFYRIGRCKFRSSVASANNFSLLLQETNRGLVEIKIPISSLCFGVHCRSPIRVALQDHETQSLCLETERESRWDGDLGAFKWIGISVELAVKDGVRGIRSRDLE